MEFRGLFFAWMTLCFITCIAASQAFAAEATGALGTRVEHTNNVRLSSSNEDSDVTQVTYGELGVEEVRKRFKADANVSLENKHYYEGTYEDSTSLTSGFGLFTIDLVEDFLEWQATFSRTDVLTDATNRDNPDPDSLEYRNIFRTGPSINYAATRTTRFNLSASYVKVANSDNSASDSERATGSARLTHQLNSITSFNLGGNYSETLESSRDDEIKDTTLSVGLSRAYAGGNLDASFGQQKVESNLSDTETGSFVDLLFTRQDLLGHDWTLKYNQSISDTEIGFEGDETGNNLEIDPTQAFSLTDIETRDRVNLSVARDADAYTYDLGLIYQESAFKIQGYTERYRGATLGISPKLYSRLTPRVGYSYARESFGQNQTIGDDTSHTLSFSLNYQLVEELYTDGFVRYKVRTNETDESRDYDELSMGIGLRWQFL